MKRKSTSMPKIERGELSVEGTWNEKSLLV